MVHETCADDGMPALRPGAPDAAGARAGRSRAGSPAELVLMRSAGRRRRRFATALAVALGLLAVVALIGFVVDRASSSRGGLRRSFGGGRGLVLLQQSLDFDEDEEEDDDDGEMSDTVRDDMLATAPPARQQTLSWLDWNEDDIEREEAKIKQKLITIEQVSILSLYSYPYLYLRSIHTHTHTHIHTCTGSDCTAAKAQRDEGGARPC